MEAMIDLQNDIYSRIVKARANFKNLPKSRICKTYVDGKLELLNRLWASFEAGHKDLILSGYKELPNSDYIKEETYDKAEENFFEYSVELKYCLLSLSNMSDLKASISKECNIKLPKVTIPKFTGQYSEWVTFRDLFLSIIHNNSRLDNVQKLLYLKSHLGGEAEQLLNNIPISDGNYDRCWKLLEDRFNNKQFICQYFLKKIMSQKNMSNESVHNLKDLINTTNDCLAGLRGIGINTGSWDVLIIHIIALKLDLETRRQWEFSFCQRSSPNDLPTYEQFQEFLMKRCRALEFLDSKFNAMNRNQTDGYKSMHVYKDKCHLCDKDHKLYECKQFLNRSIGLRREFIDSNKNCFHCLEGNHSLQECDSKLICKICKKANHHTLVHNTTVTSPEERSGKCKVQPPVVCFSTNKNEDNILLPTAQIKTMSSCKKWYTARALLDQGSQISFVTERTVQCLGLKRTPIKTIVSCIGRQNQLRINGRVKLKIRSRLDSSKLIDVEALIVDSITDLLPNNKVKVHWKELLDLELADPGFNIPGPIDVLLGAEIYGQVIQEGIKNGPFGSHVAQRTSLGWIISGLFTGTNKPIKTGNTIQGENQFNILLPSLKKGNMLTNSLYNGYII